MGGDGIRAQKSRQTSKKSPVRGSRDQGAKERPLKIGEAAKLVGVEAYVLRFWETQFSCIRPKQARSRHRYYSRGDVETLRIIKHLLHSEGYTIAGARKIIREKGLDNLTIPVAVPVRSPTGRKQKDLLRAAPAVPARRTLPIGSNNGIHRALREIRNDLRALQKLLEP